VTFSYDSVNKKLNMIVGGATTTLTPYAQSFGLLYCQLNTAAAFTPLIQADRDSIRVVIISLTMNKGSDTISLSSRAFCRNQV